MKDQQNPRAALVFLMPESILLMGLFILSVMLHRATPLAILVGIALVHLRGLVQGRWAMSPRVLRGPAVLLALLLLHTLFAAQATHAAWITWGRFSGLVLVATMVLAVPPRLLYPQTLERVTQALPLVLVGTLLLLALDWAGGAPLYRALIDTLQPLFLKPLRTVHEAYKPALALLWLIFLPLALGHLSHRRWLLPLGGCVLFCLLGLQMAFHTFVVACCASVAVGALCYGAARLTLLACGSLSLGALLGFPWALPWVGSLITWEALPLTFRTLPVRLDHWMSLLPFVTQKWAMGYGMGASSLFSQTMTEARPLLFPHSVILELWLDLGLGGILLLCGGLIVGGHFLWRLRDRPLQCGGGLALACYVFIMNLTSYGAWHSWWLSALTLSLFLMRLWVFDGEPRDSRAR